MRRRTFAAGALGLAALATAGALAALQPRRVRWAPFGAGRLSRAPSPRRVVVVGGGLAGIASAAALASKGHRVVLIERSGGLGGKLAGWPLEVLGETVPMEHGFHGFFTQYYNLRRLFAEAGADRSLVPQASYAVLFRDGREEAFARGVLPFPLDLLEVLARSPSLGLGDVAGDREGMRALLAYDEAETFRRWDGMDAAAFVRDGGLEGPFTDLVLEPFGQASMNALDELSAAELIRFFHFYMLGNPEGLGFDVLGEGVHLAVLAPLRAHLEALGVEIRASTTVARVRFDGGRAVGVELESAPDASIAVPVAQIPASGWAVVGPAFVRRTPEGFQAVDARCTHMGCPVRLDGAGFLCPCHAGRYDAEARPIAGPPEAPLRGLAVRVDGETLHVGGEPPGGERIDADAVILATEIRGLKEIARRSALAGHAPGLAAQIDRSAEALPYAVVRFWLDRPVRASRPAFYTVSGYPLTDSIATYSAFQQPFIDWAARAGGSVVECHAYAIPPALQGPVEQLRDGLLAELRQAFPELADATVLHVEAMVQSNFTQFGPGALAERPGVRTEVANLYVAGDHVRLPFPAFLMEAAVSSGRLAANAILAEDGVEEVPIDAVALRGPLHGVFGGD